MNQVSSKRFVLLLVVYFLISCNTLPHHEKHGTILKTPPQPVAPTRSVADPNGTQSDSANSGSESGAVASEEPALKNNPSDAPQTESADSMLSGASSSETFLAINKPSPTDSDFGASADSLYDESAVNPDGDAVLDSADVSDEEITYDVPIVLNESVEDYIEYFQTAIRDKFKLWLERSGRYIPIMRQIFKEQGLPEDLVFVALIESGFNPYAYSRARAVGPWQFIKGTGRLYGLRMDNWIDERRDPIKSTRAAARYLKDLYDRFGSWPLAMAGYNAGEGKIERALVKAKAADFWDLRSTRYIRRETKGYVPKFMAATIIAKNPERYGFTLDYHEPLQHDVVTLPGSADLRVVALAAGISYEDLKVLNPELRTELTPPYMERYSLRLPVGTEQTFTETYSQIPDERKIVGTRYSIRRNDTLTVIAKRFGTSVSLLREINHLPQGHLLREGEVLFIPKLQSASRESKPRPSKSALVSKKPAGQKVAKVAIERRGQSNAVDNGKKILYRVKDGDTLWDISKSFNVSIQDLKKFNGMGRRSMIRSGDQLVLGFQSKEF